MVGQVILVTGPSRSGKSEWAEFLANQKQKEITYVATSHLDLSDLEWTARIEKHKVRRPSHWEIKEEMYNLTSLISQYTDSHCLLIDSLGTWTANLLEENEDSWQNISKNFTQTIQNSTIDIILVAEETGWGLVPDYPIGRLFRDRLGALIREVSSCADIVYLVTGGYVLNLSELGIKLVT